MDQQLHGGDNWTWNGTGRVVYKDDRMMSAYSLNIASGIRNRNYVYLIPAGFDRSSTSPLTELLQPRASV